MNSKGQGALEYLLLVGGIILVAALVLSVITGVASRSEAATESRVAEAFCAPLTKRDCGARDPDGEGSFTKRDCHFDAEVNKCVGGQIPIPPGVLVFYDFESLEAGKVKDLSGNNNHGTLENGATIVTGPNATKVVSLDGDNDHVNIGNPPTLNLTSTTATVSLWTKNDITPVAGDSQMSKAESIRVYYPSASTTNVKFRINSSDTADIPAGQFNALNWNHLVGVYDGAKIRLFLNKVEVANNNLTTPISSTAENMFVGKASGAATNGTIDGQIDEFGVWDRALSTKEIEDLFNRGKP